MKFDSEFTEDGWLIRELKCIKFYNTSLYIGNAAEKEGGYLTAILWSPNGRDLTYGLHHLKKKDRKIKRYINIYYDEISGKYVSSRMYENIKKADENIGYDEFGYKYITTQEVEFIDNG